MNQELTYERPSWQTDTKYCNKCNAEIYFVKSGGVHPTDHPKAGKAKWVAVTNETNKIHYKECRGS